ncbi:MAG TPA: Ig-like domain-containing protein [Planctomycetota bacterium]|nr:Ig-like domain-containing protein [Planctomycetota bacterium]
MKRALSLTVFVLLVTAATFAPAQENKDDAAKVFPPCVVKTEPENRAMDVDPDLREIKVTFDRPMNVNRSWSWITYPDLGAYPGDRALGEPQWEDDGKTCVLPVRLRAGTVYAVGCNTFRHTGFRDRKGRIAVPHVWMFKTKAADE